MKYQQASRGANSTHEPAEERESLSGRRSPRSGNGRGVGAELDLVDDIPHASDGRVQHASPEIGAGYHLRDDLPCVAAGPNPAILCLIPVTAMDHQVVVWIDVERPTIRKIVRPERCGGQTRV